MISTHKQDALPLCFVATIAFERVKITLARNGLAPQRVGTKCSCDRQPHVDFIWLMEVLRLCVGETANATSRKVQYMRLKYFFSVSSDYQHAQDSVNSC